MQNTIEKKDYSLKAGFAALQELMQAGELSSADLTAYYLQRIENIDRAGRTCADCGMVPRRNVSLFKN